MRFKNKKVCVIGLGYVGLPLAVAFAERSKVIGFDIDELRVSELNEGFDATGEISNSQLLTVCNNLFFTNHKNNISDCNIYIVTVPTPIDDSNKPDLSALVNASSIVGSVLNKDDIVIFESTVYPGVTEDICVPVLENASGLNFNNDFYCGYSPERINPGDKERTLKKITKVISGSTPEASNFIDELYSEIIIAGTYKVSSIKVAEASKVIENIQRDVNIALINELALIFDRIGIDTNEVVNAASTKWNFIKFTPGLVGGHCIGIDPYYLTYLAEALDYSPDLILSARRINNGISKFIVNKTIEEIKKTGNEHISSSVLVLGVTFKENCPDMRNSKVIDIIEGFKELNMNVDVYDPWINVHKESKWYKHGIIKDPLLSNKRYDAIVVAVSHDVFLDYKSSDYDKLSKVPKVVIDIKSIVENPTWRL